MPVNTFFFYYVVRIVGRCPSFDVFCASSKSKLLQGPNVNLVWLL
jgi:hypothetical protein